jgi:hypothetical protein
VGIAGDVARDPGRAQPCPGAAHASSPSTHVDGTLVDGTPDAATVADVYTFHNGRVVTIHA